MNRREEIDALFVYQRENFSVVGWCGGRVEVRKWWWIETTENAADKSKEKRACWRKEQWEVWSSYCSCILIHHIGLLYHTISKTSLPFVSHQHLCLVPQSLQQMLTDLSALWRELCLVPHSPNRPPFLSLLLILHTAFVLWCAHKKKTQNGTI